MHLDRMAPASRPNRTVVMYQEWRKLLFLHWEVDPKPLASLLPPGLELDTFEGRAFVGLVPFTMRGIRPRFLPSLPWLSAFHETNVRTYVHYQGRDPGVWFFSLDAANPLAVAIARATFGLPYFHAKMSLETTGSALRYTSERHRFGPAPARSDVSARVLGPVLPAQVGSLDHFLAERYLLYSERGGRLYRGQVHHQPYPLQWAEVDSVEESLLAVSGITRPDRWTCAHYAEGVKVEVFPLQPASTSGR